MNPKSIFKSKTLAFQALTIAGAFYPPIKALISAHPTEAAIIVGLVNTALRYVTKGRVSLFA